MTHLFPAEAARAAPQPLSRARSPLPSIAGNRAPLHRAITAKRAIIAQLEAAWIAAAEADVARHLRHGVRIEDRGTWDRETWTRYLAAAEAWEPAFKPRIRRLLCETDNLERLLTSPTCTRERPDEPAQARPVMARVSQR